MIDRFADDEAPTWARFDPIRNFGMGGFGVYQAYRRLVRTELGDDGAEYVILYIWGDDHCRSIMRCRHTARMRAPSRRATR